MSNPSKYISRSVRTAYMASIIGLTLVLMFLGVLAVFLMIGNNLRTEVRETTQMDVFMFSHTQQADRNRLKNNIATLPFAKEARLISAQEAFDYVKGPEMGFAEADEILDISPINPSILIKINNDYVSVDSLDKVVAHLEASYPDLILEAHYARERVEKLDSSTKKPILIILIISSFLLFLAVAMINNTIRLAIYSNRFSIKTMTLVGASSRYIRWPFLRNAFLQGIISGILAIGLLVAVTYVLKELDIFTQSDLQLIDPKLFLYIFVILLALGLIIAWISTYLALKKYIRIKTDNLY